MKNILLLGGTGWLGNELCLAAVGRGHHMTALARGSKPFAPGVQTVVVDRASASCYEAVRTSSWDLVIELTDRPRFAREAVQSIGPMAESWVFVSSCSVYASQAEPNADETAAVLEPLAAHEEESSGFGRAKSTCEQAIMGEFDGQALIIRPGLIGGPEDPSGRSSYWPLRFAEERDPVLVPHDSAGSQRVQIIDVRDLAIFILEAGLASARGYVNAVGREHTLDEALCLAQRAAASVAALAGINRSDSTLVDFDLRRMNAQGVAPWAGAKSLPLVVPQGGEFAGFARRSDTRSLAMGLRRRDLAESFADIVRRNGPQGTEGLRSGLNPADEAELMGI